MDGLKSDALVELVDKAPTLLELAGLTPPEGMHGRSLLPILRGEADASHHRDFVRCEYYDAVDLRDHSFATMYRNERYKLVVYHGHEEGELYDLIDDPDEFDNFWHAPDKQDIKLELLKQNFDASMFAMDVGPRAGGTDVNLKVTFCHIMLERNAIHCGDTFTLLEEVQEASVDLIVCDGPYGVTDEPWDQIPSIQEFNLALIEKFTPKLKDGGALYLFGKPDCIDFIDYRKFLNLRSKIIWYQPSRLAQGRINYTNNYDIICYFIKGKKTTVL